MSTNLNLEPKGFVDRLDVSARDSKVSRVMIPRLFIEMDKMARIAVELSESHTTSFSCRVGKDAGFFSQAPD